MILTRSRWKRSHLTQTGRKIKYTIRGLLHICSIIMDQWTAQIPSALRSSKASYSSSNFTVLLPSRHFYRHLFLKNPTWCLIVEHFVAEEADISRGVGEWIIFEIDKHHICNSWHNLNGIKNINYCPWDTWRDFTSLLNSTLTYLN